MKRFRIVGAIAFSIALLCWLVIRCVSPVAAEMVVPQGLVQVASNFSVAETGDRLEALLAERRLNLVTRVDHARNAASVGKDLRDTQLFIFGNPNVGTPLMQCNQTVGIDLPQKMLIWQDATEQVWLAYNDPQYLMSRHTLSACEPILERIHQVLEDLAFKATQG